MIEAELQAPWAERVARDDAAYRRQVGYLFERSPFYREKLSAARPRSVGQASRLSGVTPVAVTILMTHLEIERRRAPHHSLPPQAGGGLGRGELSLANAGDAKDPGSHARHCVVRLRGPTARAGGEM